LGLEHGLRFSSDSTSALRQPRRHAAEGFPDEAFLGFGISCARSIRRRRERFRHAQNYASRNA
jgi:hypothetical protein